MKLFVFLLFSSFTLLMPLAMAAPKLPTCTLVVTYHKDDGSGCWERTEPENTGSFGIEIGADLVSNGRYSIHVNAIDTYNGIATAYQLESVNLNPNGTVSLTSSWDAPNWGLYYFNLYVVDKDAGNKAICTKHVESAATTNN